MQWLGYGRMYLLSTDRSLKLEIVARKRWDRVLCVVLFALCASIAKCNVRLSIFRPSASVEYPSEALSLKAIATYSRQSFDQKDRSARRKWSVHGQSTMATFCNPTWAVR
jgi:hypothetical protein